MAKKHMKRCSTSTTIEIQIKKKRNTNQNYSEVSPHISQNDHHQKVYQHKCCESVEKRDPFYTVGGNANWYNPYEEQYDSSFKKKKAKT